MNSRFPANFMKMIDVHKSSRSNHQRFDNKQKNAFINQFSRKTFKRLLLNSFRVARDLYFETL